MVDRLENTFELTCVAHGGAQQVGMAGDQSRHVDLWLDPGGRSAEDDPATSSDRSNGLFQGGGAHVLKHDVHPTSACIANGSREAGRFEGSIGAELQRPLPLRLTSTGRQD